MRRIIGIPFAFLYHQVLLIGGIIFPTTIIAIISFGAILYMPLAYLFNQKETICDSPLINESRYNLINHLLGLTLILWGGVYGAMHFYRTGKLMF